MLCFRLVWLFMYKFIALYTCPYTCTNVWFFLYFYFSDTLFVLRVDVDMLAKFLIFTWLFQSQARKYPGNARIGHSSCHVSSVNIWVYYKKCIIKRQLNLYFLCLKFIHPFFTIFHTTSLGAKILVHSTGASTPFMKNFKGIGYINFNYILILSFTM